MKTRRWIALALLLAAGRGWAQDYRTYRGDPISTELEACYARGIKSLAQTQKDDGLWGPPTDTQNGPGVSGLALLAILAHGDDPNEGPYASTCRRAVEGLIKCQDENGYIGPSMYHHGFATLALAEAYGMIDNPRLGPALKKAIDLILTSQAKNPLKAWRYAPTSTDADTTVSGAQMVALLAARNAGMAIPDEAIKKGLDFYQSCQGDDGGIGYSGPGGPNRTRTSIGTLVAALAKNKSSKLFTGGAKWLRDNKQANENNYFYYLYYIAQANFQSDMTAWREWNATNTKQLMSVQSTNGGWENQSPFTTAMALLSMALNYRYLPIYER